MHWHKAGLLLLAAIVKLLSKRLLEFSNARSTL